MSESSDSDKKTGLISAGSILVLLLFVGRFWVSCQKSGEVDERDQTRSLVETAKDMHDQHAQSLFDKALGLDSAATVYLSHTDSSQAFLQAQAPISRRQLQQAVGIMQQVMDGEHGDTTAYLHERANLVATYFQTKLRLIDLYEKRRLTFVNGPNELSVPISQEAGQLLSTTQKLAHLDSVETILVRAREISNRYR